MDKLTLEAFEAVETINQSLPDEMAEAFGYQLKLFMYGSGTVAIEYFGEVIWCDEWDEREVIEDDFGTKEPLIPFLYKIMKAISDNQVKNLRAIKSAMHSARKS